MKKLLAVGLAAFAVWLRLRLLGYTEIWEDQALTLNAALEWVHGADLPLASMKSSFGVFNPPLVEYLYALPLFFKPDIRGDLWLIALLNLAAVFVAGLATARVYGWRAAWWAALLFAVNPWAAYYGRLIWMQSFVPFFATCFFACVLLYFAHEPKPVYVALGALSLSATIQTHLTAIVLIPVVCLIGLTFFRRLKVRPILIGLLLFALSFAPFIVFEVKTGFNDLRVLLTDADRLARVDLSSLLTVLDLMQSKGVYSTLGSAVDHYRSLDLHWLRADETIASLLILGTIWGAAAILLQARKGAGRVWTPQAAGLWIMLVWLVVPVVFFLRYTQPLQNYYFLYVFPVPFILVAVFMDRLFLWLKARLHAWPDGISSRAAAAAFLPLALVSFQQARINWIGQGLLASGASGQQRVIDVQRAIEASHELLRDRPGCQLVVLSKGAGYETSSFALLKEFVGPTRVRFIQAGGANLLPSTCAVYFNTQALPATEAWLATVSRPLPQHTIVTPEQTWTFHDFADSDRQRALGRLGLDSVIAEWTNGLQLTDYGVEGEPSAGGQVQLATTWRVTRAGSLEPIHFGSYVLDDTGGVLTQMDGPGTDSTQWREGDVFQVFFSLPIPPEARTGQYPLSVALYFWPRLERVLTTDGTDLVHLTPLGIQGQ